MGINTHAVFVASKEMVLASSSEKCAARLIYQFTKPPPMPS